MRNSKPECRNPKQARSAKTESSSQTARSVLECGSPLPLLARDRNRPSSESARGLAQSKTWRQFVAAFAFVAMPLVLNAQTYSIDWSTIDGGGGTSTGGTFQVTGTIGQPDAGPPAHAGGYVVQGGFWGVIAAVQTPGAPQLTVMRSNNAVIVTWPLPATGWVLEATNALPQVAAPWPQIPPPYQTNGANLQFTEPTPAGNKFYRLHKP